MRKRKYVQEINQTGTSTNSLGAEVPVALSALGLPKWQVVTEAYWPGAGWYIDETKEFYRRDDAEKASRTG